MEREIRPNTQLVPSIHVSPSPAESLKRFLSSHPCLPAPSWPNTNLRFSLVDTSKPKLFDSPSTLNAPAWFTLMSRYPSPLGLYLYNILIYGALVGYEGPILIISKNPSSALPDPTTINTKLRNDLALEQVEKVTADWPFIVLPRDWSLNLVDGVAFITYHTLTITRSIIIYRKNPQSSSTQNSKKSLTWLGKGADFLSLSTKMWKMRFGTYVLPHTFTGFLNFLGKIFFMWKSVCHLVFPLHPINLIYLRRSYIRWWFLIYTGVLYVTI